MSLLTWGQVVMKEVIVSEEMVKDWLESGDEVLVDLARNMIGKPAPTPEQATSILQCFVVFWAGCARMGLVDLAETFGKRADLFALGLRRMGYKGGYIGGFYPEMRERGTLDQITLRACGAIKFYE